MCNAGAQFGTVNSSRLVGYTQNDWGVCVWVVWRSGMSKWSTVVGIIGTEVGSSGYTRAIENIKSRQHL